MKDVQSRFRTGEREAFERNFTLNVTVVAIPPFLTKDIYLTAMAQFIGLVLSHP